MKKKISLVLFLFFITLPGFSMVKIAVMPFKNPSGFDSFCPIGAGLSDLVRKRLMDTGKFEILSRQEIDTLKNELNLSEDAFFDSSSFPAKGGFQGVDYLIFGKVLDFGHFSKDTGIGTLGKIAGGFTHTKTTAYVRISLEVISTRTGKIIFSQNFEGKEERKGGVILAGEIKNLVGGGIKIGSPEFDRSMLGKAINKALDQLVPRVSELFKFEARILAVGSEGVVIDAGSISGIAIGKKGKVFSVKEIRNSKGEVVWQSKKMIGEAVVREAQPERAILDPVGFFEIHEGDLIAFE